ncbi:hypothetical protein ACGFNQ_24900 [Streptomyces asoensis]|uniref:hypothetical protein n=1 Tax=Streptomyces TaxID=1883 RepID=UPI00190BC829|nr:hypothetical protein [Streptomyces sp. MBT97]MBK3635618.1 hypothetical protein [Streptomyces sp. MBT97]
MSLYRAMLTFGTFALFAGIAMLYDHNYLVGALLLVAGVVMGVIPLARGVARALAGWRHPGDDMGSLADPVLRGRLKVLGGVLSALGLLVFVAGVVVESLIWAANHDDPPIPMPVLMLAGLIPAGLLCFLGYGLVNAGRLTFAGDAEGVDSGYRLGWILLGFCVLFGGSVTDPRLFWQVAGGIAIPTGVVTLATCLMLRALREPMAEIRSRYWDARRAAAREEAIRAGRISPDGQRLPQPPQQ